MKWGKSGEMEGGGPEQQISIKILPSGLSRDVKKTLSIYSSDVFVILCPPTFEQLF